MSGENFSGGNLAATKDGAKAGDQKFCHACAKIIHISATMCPDCGALQQPDSVGINKYKQASNGDVQHEIIDQCYCRGCGSGIHASALACPHCGARQSINSHMVHEVAYAVKSRHTGAILAFFLGGLGVHKFYCGKIGFGFLYLIFFWTWIPAIVALVEGVIFLANSSTDEEFTRKYCV